MKIEVFSKSGFKSRVLVANDIATIKNIADRFKRWEYK